MPPSSTISSPVIRLAASEHRNTIRLATSLDSAVPPTKGVCSPSASHLWGKKDMARNTRNIYTNVKLVSGKLACYLFALPCVAEWSSILLGPTNKSQSYFGTVYKEYLDFGLILKHPDIRSSTFETILSFMRFS